MTLKLVSGKAGNTWYDLFSSSPGEPLVVLVAGLGAQAVEQWDDPLCFGLAEHGYTLRSIARLELERPPQRIRHPSLLMRE